MQKTLSEIQEKLRKDGSNRVQLTDLKAHIGLLMGPKPFQVVSGGIVIAEVMDPDTKWYLCENCGENTKNCIQFQGENYWEKLILCDRCKSNLLK